MNSSPVRFRNARFSRTSTSLRSLAAALGLAALAGCTTLGSSGPASRAVTSGESDKLSSADIRVIDMTDQVARRIVDMGRPLMFSESFGDVQPTGTVIGNGDVLTISIWEAPPAVLFGMMGQVSAATATQATTIEAARSTDMPQQMVDEQGMISLPFVGNFRAAGKTPRQVESEIESRLRGIANRPQALVGIGRNATSNVTVVGEVTTNSRVPLTPRGERLLDILAVAGGARQQSDKTIIQLTRGNQVASMPLMAIIRDPRQNIRLQADDVVTAFFQPYSFTALGASGANAEVPFEAIGITLSQALGRIGGLQDNRANVQGVFLFRLEDPAVLGPELAQGARTTPDGKIPVIYRIDLSDPGSFFIAQGFPIRDRDVLYVSNAPGVDIQKFVSILSQTAFSIIGVSSAVVGNN